MFCWFYMFLLLEIELLLLQQGIAGTGTARTLRAGSPRAYTGAAPASRDARGSSGRRFWPFWNAQRSCEALLCLKRSSFQCRHYLRATCRYPQLPQQH
jgi:hypothetical protein